MFIVLALLLTIVNTQVAKVEQVPTLSPVVYHKKKSWKKLQCVSTKSKIF